MTGYEAILAEVEARLTTPTDFVDGSYGTRRGHLTIVPREAAPGSHIVGGDDNLSKRGERSMCSTRKGDFTVSIFTRNDAGSKTADPYLPVLYARLSAPFVPPFPPGIVITPKGIRRETEVADSDAARTDCRFEMEYPTAGEWSLEFPE